MSPRILRSILYLVTLFLAPAAFAQHAVALSCIASVTPVVQYNLYREGIKIAGPLSTCQAIDSIVTNGATYHYTMRAVDSTGLESLDSNLVTAVIPQTSPPPPTSVPSTLIIPSSNFTFSVQSGSPDPAAQSFTVGDSTPSGVHVPFMIGTDQTWLWATPDSFSTNATIAINIKAAGLTAGTYIGNVFVSASDYTFNGATYTFTNSPVNIPVTLTVTAPPPPPPPTVTLTSIGFMATAPLKVGAKVQLTALANYSNGTQSNITPLVTWTSSSTARLSISTTGLATVKTAGLVTISVSLTGKTQVTTVK